MIATIMRETALEYRLPVEAMNEPDRLGTRVDWRCHPRQAGIYLASCLTPHTSVRIGQLFGGRDHSTVIHAVRAVTKRLSTDRKLQEEMRRIARRVLA